MKTFDDRARDHGEPAPQPRPTPSAQRKRHLPVLAYLVLYLLLAVVAGIVYLFVIGDWLLGAAALGMGAAILSVASRSLELKSSAPGTIRVETVRAHRVNYTIGEYRRKGWDLKDQSSAKSFGTQARVTMTFRKR